VRPSGKEIDAKEAAPKKAPKPMDARLFGRATESRVLQLEKAKSPMEVRLSGSATESRVLQPKKAQTAQQSSIEVRPSGRTRSVYPMQS